MAGSFSFQKGFSFLLLLFFSSTVAALSPPNPFLADSIWPLAQHDNYAQASTAALGPLEASHVDTLFTKKVAGPLTLLYTPDGSVVWGSSFTSVFKVNRKGQELVLIDSIEKPIEWRRNDTFRGIYSILSKENIFYISSSNIIAAYGDSQPNNHTSGVKLVGSFDFSTRSYHQERILALSMSFDGCIVFLTNQGRVGVLSRSLAILHDVKSVVDQTLELVTVTNSMSIDEYGGIYVVSSKYMHRLWWDNVNKVLYSLYPTTNHTTPHLSHKEEIHSTHESLQPIPTISNMILNRVALLRRNDPFHDESYHPTTTTTSPHTSITTQGVKSFGYRCRAKLHCHVWSTPYPIDDRPIVGRPTKEGSGTTPSLLKDEHSGKLYVMIADGKRNQEVLAIDSETGDIVSSAPVSFDTANSESYTEQSILVSGNRFLVTQNALTPPATRLNTILDIFNAQKRISNRGLPQFVEDNIHLLPVVLGDSPRGYQQFELRTLQQPPKIVTTWTRNDVGCPNAIPTMSVTTGAMYCVGKQTRALGNYPMQGFNGGWTVEALNWNDGSSIFRVDTGRGLLFNSLYAATQIGPDREILYGSIGGLVRVRGLAGKENSRANNRLVTSVVRNSASSNVKNKILENGIERKDCTNDNCREFSNIVPIVGRLSN